MHGMVGFDVTLLDVDDIVDDVVVLPIVVSVVLFECCCLYHPHLPHHCRPEVPIEARLVILTALANWAPAPFGGAA